VKNRLLKDSWFQMFAAIGGVAMVVSALGTVSSRHDLPVPAATATAPAAVPAAAPTAKAPAAAVPGSEEVITPAPASSSDLAAYNGSAAASRSPGALIMPPTASPPPPAPASNPAPQMTLTGAGIGNNQGIVGAAAGGGGVFGGFLSGLMGVAPRQAAPAAATYNRILPSQSGIFSVGKAGLTGSDTDSLRDAVFSAANGDLILVKPGTYEGPIEITGKSVRIRGTGASPGDVVVRWTGPGATISARFGALDLENVRVTRGSFFESPISKPGGAVYAAAATVTMRKVELSSDDSDAPPLIVEKIDSTTNQPTRVSAEGSTLTGSRSNLIARGAVSMKFTRVRFESGALVGAAWLDAVIELVDCRFRATDKENVFYAYEGARVLVKGEPRPKINGVRGSDATTIEQSFGGARVASARGGFSRDIFRRGRQPGTLP